MKIFEIQFTYDEWDKQRSNDTGSIKNPFRVRMMFPRDKKYDTINWSYNHRILKKEFNNKHNPTINGSTYDRKYWVYKIRRVR